MRGSLLEALKQCGVINKDLTLYVRVERRLRNNPDLVMLITSATRFLLYSAPLKARLYCIIKNITHQPVCKCCGGVLKMRTSGKYRYTFAEFCGPKCFADDPVVKDQRAATNLERYGYVNATLNKEVVAKRRAKHHKTDGN